MRQRQVIEIKQRRQSNTRSPRSPPDKPARSTQSLNTANIEPVPSSLLKVSPTNNASGSSPGGTEAAGRKPSVKAADIIDVVNLAKKHQRLTRTTSRAFLLQEIAPEGAPCKKSLNIFRIDNPIRKFCLWITSQKPFDGFIFFMIVCNCVFLALDNGNTSIKFGISMENQAIGASQYYCTANPNQAQICPFLQVRMTTKC